MEYATVALIIALGAWSEWRFRQLERQIGARPSSLTLIPEPQEQMFPCYYCGMTFPVSQRETIGNYEYCKAHGQRRKDAMLAAYRKEVQRNDRTVGVHTADRGSELSDNSEFPWIS